MLQSLFLPLLTLLLSSSHAAAALTLNNYFSSHMVLQRTPQQAVIWGYGDPGQTVNWQLDSLPSGSVTASDKGNFTIQLPATEYTSGNHTIAVYDDNTRIQLDDVLFGDVYLCSGQSNMQITLNYSFDAALAMARSSMYQNVRLFNLPVQQSNWTLDEASVSWQPNSWVLPSNSTLQNPNNVWDRSSYFSATCYWTAMNLVDQLAAAGTDIPIGLVQASVGGTQVAAWTSNDTNLVCGPLPTPFGSDNAPRNWPSVEYNAMINPLLPMRFRAVLWYQGETDWWDADRYACSFPNMINDWRTKFSYSDSLPFYFVLVHPYNGANPVSRQSQLQALKLNNVGVASAIDLGDRYGIAGDIHPRNKSFVGHRLSRLLLRDIYQYQLQVNGPWMEGITAQTVGTTLTVTLKYSSDHGSSDGMFALPTPDCNASLIDARGCCFEQPTNTFTRLITYSWPLGDGSIYTGKAPATIDATARTITVVEQTPLVPAAGTWMTVSYAFVDWPGCALYNQDRLPALPFRMNVTVTGGSSAPAVLKLNNFFSNNMVLQRAPQQAVVWGTGVPGTIVTVKVESTDSGSATVSEAGTWSVQLPPQDPNLYSALDVSDGTTDIHLDSVAFGDVYLCSGQSNMQVTLNYSFGGSEAITSSAIYSDTIRLFSYYASYNDTPLDEQSAVAYSPGSWQGTSSSSLQPSWDPSNVWAYFSATCYWAGKYISDSMNGTIPIGLVHSSYAGTPVVAWTSSDAVDKCGPLGPAATPIQAGPWGRLDGPLDPSAEFNAMIHPLLPARFAGVLWYQGESDGWNIERYKCSFPNMIANWREKFQQPDLPFYFVLLSPYTGCDPRLREAQLSALASPHVGVASAIDLGDRFGFWGDVHPRNKSYIGERLARWVRRDIYGQQVEVEGPKLLYITARATNGSLTLTLHYSNDSRSHGLFALATPDCNMTATDASRCCSQQSANTFDSLITYSWPAADGSVHAGTGSAAIDTTARTLTIVDRSGSTPPTGASITVSYAFVQWPGCALYNEHRLPALPFRMNVSVNVATPLTLNNLFSSNMVLQRAPQQAVVWGTSEPGSSITVQLDGKDVASATATEMGAWRVQLPAQEASLDRAITVSDGASTVTMHNVAFGDVYLCSGQSNMQVTINYTFGGSEAIAAASNYPHLRLFNIPGQYSNTTVDQAAITYADGWVMPNATTLQNANSWQDTWSYFSATCYWSGMKLYDSLKGDIPIGLVQASYGGTCVAAWTSPDTNTRCGPIVTPVGGDNTAYNRPSVLYNAMIYPLLPLRIRAVLWYQGETDWWDADRYACSFPNMINDWRTKFQLSELPFYFVELAPYDGAPVAVRESQKQALLLPATGVANAIDLGDRLAPAGEVHPRNKSYIGERLSLLLRRDIYGQQVEAEGPAVVSARAYVTNDSPDNTTFRLTVQFSDDSRSQNMFAQSTPGCLVNGTWTARSCCTVLGLEQYTVYAGLMWYSFTSASGQSVTMSVTMSINQTDRTITTTGLFPPYPVAGQSLLVSHAYVDWPGCVLYNGAGLPALPFQLNVTVTGSAAPAPLRLNNLFSNNMVLQRAPQQAVMWGYGEPGRTVTVALLPQNASSAVSAVVSNVGTWSVPLPATPAAMQRTITVSDGSSTITLTNVAFGDVYLCSGQSNMQVTLNYSFYGADAMAAASMYPNLRLFNKPPQNNTVAQIETLVSYSPDSWVLPSAATLADPYSWDDYWLYFSATCFWSGKHIYDSLNGSVAIGLVQSSFGGTVASAWTSPDANTKCGPMQSLPAGRYEDAPFNYPSVLYNAMIHPLLPMRFTAVLWYQGESDYYDVDRYKCAFPNMIADWRDKFQLSDLPFYFVLLSPYTGADDTLPQQRLAQLSAFPSHNVGVASAIDLGDLHGDQGDIHPRNKSFVGERLARWVRHDIYKQDVQPLGPEPLNDAKHISLSVSGGTAAKVVLTYPDTDANSGLYMMAAPDCTTCCGTNGGVLRVSINDTAANNNGSSVAPGKRYRPAVAIDQTARTLTATFDLDGTVSEHAMGIVGLHAEAWPQCVLYNKHGLPALPFIISVVINGGDEAGTSGWYLAIAAVLLLVGVGVGIWLCVHYGRKRRVSADAEAGGYRDVDERTTSLLGDSNTSS